MKSLTSVLLFLSTSALILQTVDSISTCNLDLKYLSVLDGQNCRERVLAHRDHQCYLWSEYPGRLFDSATGSFKKTPHDCFGASDGAICNEGPISEIPTCASPSLISIRPHYCSIGGTMLGCGTERVASLMYVIDASRNKHYVSHIALKEEVVLSPNNILALKKDDCTQTNYYCSNSAIEEVLKLSGKCTNRDLQTACEAYLSTMANTQRFLMVSDCSIPIICYGSEDVKVQDFMNHKHEVVIADRELNLHCTSVGLLIEVFTPRASAVRVCSSRSCTIVEFSNRKAIVERALSDLVQNTRYEVGILSGGSVMITRSILCQGRELCSAIPCFVCLEFVLNPKCWSGSIWIGVLIVLYLISVVLITLLWILRPLLLVLKCLKVLIMKLIRSASGFNPSFRAIPKFRLRQKKSHSDEGEMIRLNESSNDESWIMDMTPTRLAQSTRGDRTWPHTNVKKPVNRAPASFLTIIALVLILISLGATEPIATGHRSLPSQFRNLDCHFTEVSETKGTHCSRDSTKNLTSCVAELDHSIKILPIGQKYCMVVKKEVENQPISYLTVTANSISLVCNKRILYYTRDLDWQHISQRRCNEAGWCSGLKCLGVSNSSILDYMIPYRHTSFGLTQCESVPGGWGNGCFYLSDGCLSWRWFATLASDDIYELSDCPSWRPSLNITLSFNDEQGYSQMHAVLSPGSVLRWRGVRMTSSISVNTVIPILSKKFVQKLGDRRGILGYSDQTFLIDAPEPGSLTLNSIGQVQCSKFSDAMTLENCGFNHKICDCLNSGDGVNCECSTAKPRDYLLASSSLPIISGDLLVKVTRREIHIEYPSSSSASLEIQGLLEVVPLSSTIQEKCSFVPKIISGCYSCLKGASFEYACRSEKYMYSMVDCGTVQFPVTCSNLTKTQVTHFLTDIPSQNFQCRAACDPDQTPRSIASNLEFHGNRVKIGISRLSLENGLTKWRITDSFNRKLLGELGYIRLVLIIALTLLGLLIIHLVVRLFISPLYSLVKDKIF